MDEKWLIEFLGLKPLPQEGGYYRETYRCENKLHADVLPGRYVSDKNICTAIYYLLTPRSSSTMHRLPTDEIYHFYLGDPVEMLILHPDGRGENIILGNDLAAGESIQHVVPGGSWQGAYLAESCRFALMGTTMAPGYDPDDFEPGNCESLIAQYPDHAGLIRLLTRN